MSLPAPRTRRRYASLPLSRATLLSIALRSPAPRKPRVYIHVHPLGGAKHASLKDTAEPLWLLWDQHPCWIQLPGGTYPALTLT